MATKYAHNMRSFMLLANRYLFSVSVEFLTNLYIQGEETFSKTKETTCSPK